MMGFFLFLLVNATLFIRPAEIIPELLDLPIYNVLILSCFGVSFPAVVRRLRARALAEEPLSMCVVGLLVVVTCSSSASSTPRTGSAGT
jgi:hypothetical protein